MDDDDHGTSHYYELIEKLKPDWIQKFSCEIPERTIRITPIKIPYPRQRAYVSKVQYDSSKPNSLLV